MNINTFHNDTFPLDFTILMAILYLLQIMHHAPYAIKSPPYVDTSSAGGVLKSYQVMCTVPVPE
jgi:hypothetical protein